MGDVVIAAVVAGIVSLAVTFGKIALDARHAKEERRLAARERLDTYRAPLLAAVDDLGRRVNNIRKDGFLAYLDMDDRRDMAIQATLFRLAQYLGWTEIIYGSSDRLRFESDKATRAVRDTLVDIAWILASDKLDRTDEDDLTTSQLMLWREEQRAIGELMRQAGDEFRCIGFSSFADNYKDRFSRWFDTFASQLQNKSASSADRLGELQRVLARLACQLDVDGELVQLDGSKRITEPRWAQPSNLPEPTRHTSPKSFAGFEQG